MGSLTAINKIPPLQCPQCESTLVYIGSGKSVYCHSCKKKTTKTGKVIDLDTPKFPIVKNCTLCGVRLFYNPYSRICTNCEKANR